MLIIPIRQVQDSVGDKTSHEDGTAEIRYSLRFVAGCTHSNALKAKKEARPLNQNWLAAMIE